MTKLESYAEYKDSEVDWLGKVPGHWGVVPMRHLATIETGSKDTVDAVESGHYPFIVRSPRPQRINSFSYDCEAILTAGDGDVGKIFHHICGRFDVHQRVYVLRNFQRVTGRFLYYYLSQNFINVAADGSAKSTVDSLRRPTFTNFPCTVPSLDEQRKISEFLDRETAQIDDLIAKQEHLIELLAEKRQAVITQAVTKGLDPTASTKSSGIPWQGNIPTHWTIRPLKNLMQMQTGVTLGKDFTDVETNSYAYLRVANVQIGYVDLSDVKEIRLPLSIATSSLLRPGDVLMTEGGDRDKLARGCIWGGAIDPCVHQNHIFAVRTNRQLLNEFLVYALDADPARRYFYMTGKQSTNLASTNSTTVKNFKFGVPPLGEQEQIVDYLKLKTRQLDELTSKSSAVISTLRERRSALISAAVTGKIAVA